MMIGLLAAACCIPSASAATNPAEVPTELPEWRERHTEKVEAARRGNHDLLLIGDSITHLLENPDNQAVWDQYFGSRHALDLGYSGDRIENILWNLQHDELTGQSPKAATLLIGTNNADEVNYPTHHTPEQIAGGVRAIVRVLRQKLPNTKIMLLRCFPYGEGAVRNHRRIVLDRASDLFMGLADGKHVFYCDVNHVFLKPDGSIDPSLMPDYLHPNPAGVKLWAQAMEPMLSTLMGDASHDTEIPANSAIVPASKLEDDVYDWWARHADVLKARRTAKPDIVLIGDSITHFWGGEPKANVVNGAKAWASVFSPYRTLNLGFGWDRTQNVLWRLDHGELDGLHPRVVVINIGTNNTSETPHARENTPTEIADGVRAICTRVRSKAPEARIILMGIFPREQKPDAPRRRTIAEINRRLAELGSVPGIQFMDIGAKLLEPDGTISADVMSDYCHPTEKGYRIWADSLAPEIQKILGPGKPAR